MKKNFLSLLVGVLLTSTAFAQTNLRDISATLAKRSDFVGLINELATFSDSPKDYKKIEELGQKDKLTEAERQALLNSFGFANLEEAYDFDINNYNIVKTICNELHLDRLTKTELSTVFTDAIEIIPNYAVPSAEKRTCEQKRQSCRTGAWGVYLVEHAGCATAGIGIGVLSFWCAGCVGAGVWAACATGASMHMSSMLDDCQDRYDDCRGH